ncbi:MULTISPECIES: BMP family ABC transporter substrate-binding protein [unclassified Undibacterium]|uniref:BMP family lipoprotein n=1 Tax=unclassified Undibacterium TaxID=2630295 RepID=UPI002AC8C8C5|nr:MULTISPECIES: BMP family ABC transporter substrate-binding protein [unclassified Undibacterium]MEB0140754.1 BMP family ABC transporter substrate-binding protein [Undibacterium sp. CCC2.1]MEB0173959.1 BMP family ABC transporter substrate-binding protein [Undibacterium sp. CCC1.1]MEB0177747.1 BMP family ABC transporter substrate-binding protein [Undibacterium sp. CCC3.4]MEB0217122.1 BMP family ABC transporter substrate-binding protein [Undibacterium sp. 5I2]WPX45547.1 BMP family ABC transport
MFYLVWQITAAQAADLKLALVYDGGGKFDQSFNQSAATGAERFKKDTGINYLEVQISQEAQTEQVLRNLARRKTDLIAAIGFSQAQAVQAVAKEFPNVKFLLIDAVANGDNINSIIFKEQEGAYLVGMAAALVSKNKHLGFIGGMDIPLIRAFACGYVQGAKAVDQKITITQNMIGTTISAWNDPAKGSDIARSQFVRGADVVFAAAGGSGAGILQAAKEKNRYAIGVDSNQNHLYPGTMLTSMVKNIDVAVYDNFMQVKNGTWRAGVQNLGLKERGVDWALDKDNRALISSQVEQRVNQARQEIIAGKLLVADYRSEQRCPL